MNLQRRETRFGLAAFREPTPDSDKNGSNEAKFLLPESENDSANKLRKRSWELQDSEEPFRTPNKPEIKDRGDFRPSPSKLIPAAVRAQVDEIRDVKNHMSPWKGLTKRFNLSLEDSVTIATRKDGLFFAVREISGRDADLKISMLHKIRNANLPNFLAFLESFSYKGSFYAIFEHEIIRSEKLPVTLSHYALIKPYPTESQLAFILRQILEGLKSLAELGLEHGALTCKNILISTEGSIRIARQECSRKLNSPRGSGGYNDIKGVGYVTMELMHKVAKYEGHIRVSDPDRWPLETEAAKFLLAVASGSSIEELIKHPLLSCEGQESDIIDIRVNVYTAEFSVFRGDNILS